MITLTWIFTILYILVDPERVLASNNLEDHDCDNFEEGASFDPYIAIADKWKVFYYWGNNYEHNNITFRLPNRSKLNSFKEAINANDPSVEIEWNKATLVMQPRPGTLVLLLSDGYPGSFQAIVKIENPVNKVGQFRTPLIKLVNVRMKIIDRYLGIMGCEDLSAFALARIDEMPQTKIQVERGAASLGLQGPNGKSYLEARSNKRVISNDEL